MSSLIEMLATKKKTATPPEGLVILPVAAKEHGGSCGPNCACAGEEESGCCGG